MRTTLILTDIADTARRNKCKVMLSLYVSLFTDAINVHVSDALDQEKNTAAVFQRLPFHYLEISKILFVHAKEAFGTDLLKVSRSQ